MSFKLSESSNNTLLTVNKDLQKVVLRALEITKVDFGIPSDGGLRTAEEQNALFELGKSQLDGYKKKSYHQTGNAIDVYAYINGGACWDKYLLMMVATAMLQAASELGVKLAWGGNWKKFIDMPHFELIN